MSDNVEAFVETMNAQLDQFWDLYDAEFGIERPPGTDLVPVSKNTEVAVIEPTADELRFDADVRELVTDLWWLIRRYYEAWDTPEARVKFQNKFEELIEAREKALEAA